MYVDGRQMTTKICTGCKCVLPRSSDYFGPDKRNVDNLQSMCRVCKNSKARKSSYTEAMRKANKEWRKRDPLRAAYRDKKTRCNGLEIRFDLTLEEFKILRNAPNCESCNKELTYKISELDQKIPGAGYYMENVGVLCKQCNTIKSNASLQQVLYVIEYMKKIFEGDLK